MSPASRESAAPANVRSVFAAFWVGLSLGLAVLALPLGPADGRTFTVEARAYLLLFPLFFLWVLAHVRRRLPRLGPASAWLFVAVVLFRLLVLCLMVDRNGRVAPDYQGHYPGDPGMYATRSVLLAAYLGSEVAPERADELFQEVWGKLLTPEHLKAPDELEVGFSYYVKYLRRAVAFAIPPAVLVLWFGYSTVLMILPVALLSAFLVVQAWTFTARCISTKAAPAVALWALLSPVVIFEAAIFRKEIYVTVGMLYVFEALHAIRPRVSPAPVMEPNAPLGILLAALLSYLARPDYLRFIVGVVIYAFVREYIPNRRVRIALDLAAAFALAVRFHWDWRTSLTGVWLMPGPSTLFFPERTFEQTFQLPLALVWPAIAALFTTGLLLRIKQGGPPTAMAVVAMTWMLAVIPTRFVVQNPTKRLCVEVMVIALAASAPERLRREPPATQRRLVGATAMLAGAIYAFHALIAAYSFLD